MALKNANGKLINGMKYSSYIMFRMKELTTTVFPLILKNSDGFRLRLPKTGSLPEQLGGQFFSAL